MKNFLRVLILFSVLTVKLSAQSLTLANASAKKDLNDALLRLNELREKIEEEKIPLSSEIRKLEREAQAKRIEVDRLNRLRDNRDANLIQLKEEVQEGETELDSISRVLKNYTRSWSETIPPAEWVPLENLREELSQPSNPSRKETIQWLLSVSSISANFKCSRSIS